MMYLLWIVLGLGVGFGGWQLAVWYAGVMDKNKKFRAASTRARESGKPMLVAGGPWGTKRIRHILNVPAHGNGDVCLDINYCAIEGHPCGLIADVAYIPFADKSFGAAFASHLLEHLPSTGKASKALAELNRVADAVFIVSPSKQSVGGWLTADHHLWVRQRDGKTYFEQRGNKTGHVEATS